MGTAGFLFTSNASKSSDCSIITVTTPNGSKISTETARTPSEWQQGLSGRTSLGKLSGMIFLFPVPGTHPFWMKNTLIPLDIIWLDNKKVVEIATLAPQDGVSIPQHTPQHNADAVLEINAQHAEELGITVGSTLNWGDCE